MKLKMTTPTNIKIYRLCSFIYIQERQTPPIPNLIPQNYNQNIHKNSHKKIKTKKAKRIIYPHSFYFHFCIMVATMNPNLGPMPNLLSMYPIPHKRV